MLENIKENFGNFHVVFSGLNEEQLNILQNNVKLEVIGSKADTAIDKISKNQTLIVSNYNKTALDMLYIALDKGKMLSNDNEIAVEKWVLDR